MSRVLQSVPTGNVQGFPEHTNRAKQLSRFFRHTGSWKAISLEPYKSLATNESAADSAQAVASQVGQTVAEGVPQTAEAVDQWGTSDSDWGQGVESSLKTVDRGKMSADDCNFGPRDNSADAALDDLATHLQSALAVSSAQAGAGSGSRKEMAACEPQKQAKDQASKALSDSNACGHISQTAGPLLPEFYLLPQKEPGQQEMSMSQYEQERIAMLIARYEEGNIADAGELGTMYSNTDNTWVGEKYEKVAPRGVTATFLKFKKRLGRCPRQCVRYGGKPLWPGCPPVYGKHKCVHCGSQLHFVLQLMSPLIAMIYEAAEWLGEGADVVVPQWEWQTVAVFTCMAGCHSEFCSEQVVVVSE